MEHVLTFFESSAYRFPEKVAVASKDKKYTFRELRNRAIILAKNIQNQVTKRNQPIVVIVSRDADALVYFLAVLYSPAV